MYFESQVSTKYTIKRIPVSYSSTNRLNNENNSHNKSWQHFNRQRSANLYLCRYHAYAWAIYLSVFIFIFKYVLFVFTWQNDKISISLVSAFTNMNSFRTAILCFIDIPMLQVNSECGFSLNLRMRLNFDVKLYFAAYPIRFNEVSVERINWLKKTSPSQEGTG